MTKNEYLTRLGSELKKNNVADAEDILGEYEQHFAFKLADGYSEEEIAAKLGAPEAIAAQFESEKGKSGRKGGLVFTKIALAFLTPFEAIFYLLFFVWVVCIAAVSVASAAIGVCLIGHLNIAGLLPVMPYAGAVILGISFLALAVLLFALAAYCFAYARQIVKASVRWHKNMTSAGALPPLPWSPQFGGRARRRLRAVLLWAVAVFGASFVLGYIVLSLQAGALEFWHVWGWFVR